MQICMTLILIFIHKTDSPKYVDFLVLLRRLFPTTNQNSPNRLKQLICGSAILAKLRKSAYYLCLISHIIRNKKFNCAIFRICSNIVINILQFLRIYNCKKLWVCYNKKYGKNSLLLPTCEK